MDQTNNLLLFHLLLIINKHCLQSSQHLVSMNLLRDLFYSIDSMDKEANRSRDCNEQILEVLDYSDNSEYSQDYLRILQIKDKSEFSSLLNNSIGSFGSEVKYDNTSEFLHRIQISITRYTDNYEYVNVSVRLGHFYFPKITLIYINTKNFCKQSMLIGQGAFCHVYRCKFKGKFYAFKCFNRIGGLKDQLFETMIKEYCIFLIASKLKAAPKAAKLYGFDIAVYEDFAQFGMECCEKVSINKWAFQKIDNDLKENLLVMHSFSLIHYDIKIENVGYSPSFKRFVYLDFGLSEVIFKTLGTKINLYFKGTPNYCSPQFAILERNGKKGFIDPYYNDLCCYKQTINILWENNTQFKQIENVKDRSREQIQDVTKRYRLYQLKYLVFEHKIKQIQEIISQNILSYQELMTLLEFSQGLKVSLMKHKITIIIAKKVSLLDTQKRKYLYILEENDKKQKDQLAPRAMKSFLTKILPSQLSSYYIKKMELHESSQVYQYLANSQIRKGLKEIQYFEVLARALKFNSLLFNDKQINNICTSFGQTNAQNIKNLNINSKCSIQSRLFAQICLFLFNFSLQNITKRQNFHIFMDIAGNVVICKILNLDQVKNIYQKILSFSLNFQRLVKILLLFNTIFLWSKFQIDNWIEFNQFYTKILGRNQLYLQQACAQIQYSQQQKKILRILLSDDFDYQYIQIQQSKCQLTSMILNDIKIYQLHKSFHDRAKLSSKQLIRLKECISQRQYFYNSNFEYYHFRLILYYFENSDSQSAISIYKQYQKTMVVRRSQSFKILIQKMQQIDKMKQRVSDINYITKLSEQIKLIARPILCYYLYKKLIKEYLSGEFKMDISKNENKKFMMNIKQILESLINFNMCLHKRQVKGKLDTIHNRLMIQNYYQELGLVNKQTIQQKRSLYLQPYLRLDNFRIVLSKKQVMPFAIKKLLLLAYILHSTGSYNQSLQLQQRIIRLSIFNKRTLIYIIQYLTFTMPLDGQKFAQIVRKRFIHYYSLVNQIQCSQILFHRIYFLESIADIIKLQNKNGLIQLLKKMVNLLKIYNNKQNFQIICIFARNFTLNLVLSSQFQVLIDIIKNVWFCNNQYQFIYLFYIYLYTKIMTFEWIYRRFLKCASSLRLESCLFFASQIYLLYVETYSNMINQRKVKFISKQVFRFRMLQMSRDNKQRLIFDQRSLSKLRYSYNIDKYRCLQKKIPGQGRNFYQIDLLKNLLYQNQKEKGQQ